MEQVLCTCYDTGFIVYSSYTLLTLSYLLSYMDEVLCTQFYDADDIVYSIMQYWCYCIYWVT